MDDVSASFMQSVNQSLLNDKISKNLTALRLILIVRQKLWRSKTLI